MDSFSKLHPLAIFLYYGLAVFLMIWLAHPALNALIWILSLPVFFGRAGRRKGISLFGISLAGALLCLVMNPLFNQRGLTLLLSIGGRRITLESMAAGAHMASMLMASLLLFANFSHYMTSRKIMTLFGRRLSSLALLFSMILRFVPGAARDFREMSAIHGSGPAVWAGVFGLTLEGATERSFSMKAKGYGARERSSYYYRRLAWREVVLLVFMALAGGVILWQEAAGLWQARFFPGIKLRAPGPAGWLAPVLFYSLPLLVAGKEEFAWLLSRRKITGSSIRMNQLPPCRFRS